MCGYEIVHDACNIPEVRIRVKALQLDFETDMMPALPYPWDQWYEPKGDSGNNECASQE